MEQLLLRVREYPFHWLEIFSILMALVTCLLSNQAILLVSFIYLSYTYLKNQRASYIYFIVLTITLALNYFLFAYYLALVIISLFLIIQCLKLGNYNYAKVIPWLIMIIAAIFNYFLTLEITSILLGISIGCYSFCLWNDNEKQSFQAILLLLIFALLLLIMQYWQKDVLILIGFIFFFYYFPKTASMMLFVIALCMNYPLLDYSLLYMGCLCFKQDKLYYLFLGFAYFLLLHNHLTYLMVIAMLLIKLFNDLIYPLPDGTQTSLILNDSSNLIRRKLQAYSGIFESLAQYYRFSQPQAAYLLTSLSHALASPLQELSLYHHQDEIKQCLETYHYHVSKVEVEKHRIDLTINHIKKGEIEETIIPLLENLSQKHLMLTSISYHALSRGYQFELVCDIPYHIDASGASLKNMFDENGDTYSTFQFRDNYIMLICDGMGNGERAYESAKLVSSLFQKLIVSGMGCNQAISCINQLVQSECFTTVDVIFFNPSKRKAILLKSAACPTYLIRDNKLLKIEGEALPVGIIDQMEPDCREIDIEENDIFLLVSDGIYEGEINRWYKTMNSNDVEKESDRLYKILKEENRLDDSTFVLGIVKSNN